MGQDEQWEDCFQAWHLVAGHGPGTAAGSPVPSTLFRLWHEDLWLELLRWNVSMELESYIHAYMYIYMYIAYG